MQENAEQIQKSIENRFKDEAVAVFRQIMSEITQTPEFKKAKNDTVIKALSSWSGESMFKKMVSNRMHKKITEELKDAQYAPKTDINNVKVWENIGKLITLGSQYMAQKDKTDPNRVANMLEKPLTDLLRHTDFGIIYEMIAVSEARAIATQEKIQQVMGEFPTKSGILPAIKLKKTNTAIKKRNLSLKNMENMPPEMLLSSMLNLVKSLIEAKELGTLINQVSELIRKCHTGNVILGEAGKSAIELTLLEKLADSWPEVDPVVFRKAVVGLLESYEAVSSAVMASISEQPEVFGELVSSFGLRKNTTIIRKSKKAALLEEFIDESDGTALIEKGLADLDTQEIGETLNTWLRIINSIHESQSDVALTPLSSLVSIIDLDELETAAQWILPNIIESIKPIAGAVMPSLINGVCELLTPEPGEDSEQIDEALSNLRNILSRNGGEPT